MFDASLAAPLPAAALLPLLGQISMFLALLPVRDPTGQNQRTAAEMVLFGFAAAEGTGMDGVD